MHDATASRSDVAPPAAPLVHPLGTDARVLLTSVFGPYARDDEYGSRAINPLAEVPYLIRATPANWKSVLSGKTDPIVGLMGGKLKLAKGSLFALLPYAKAAKELVNSAIRVDTSFPDGW